VPGARTQRWGQHLVSYLWLLPPVSLLAVFVGWPFLTALTRSLRNWNGANVDEFVGLSNYHELFTDDPLFLESLEHAAILTGGFVVQSVAVPLAAAYLIHHVRSRLLQRVSRVMVVIPTVVPTVLIYLLWAEFLQPDGLVNQLLDAVGADGLQRPWLGDSNLVLGALLFVGFPWLNGINALILLAGLLNIDAELYEAAQLDGAGRWHIFSRIEWPLIRPQVRLIAVLGLIFSLQNYENVYVLTQGGPADASVVPGLLLYNNAFRYGRFGYASAIGVVLFVVILALTLLALRSNRERNAT
jgi:raffinose/stachyose/melibiose transport system permease protein